MKPTAYRMEQRHWCHGLDGQALINDCADYPGAAYGLREPTPSLLRFFWLFRHESPRYNQAFSKKAQHRWRWIPLRTFTRGRLVPRQPRAIKRTTPTALHHERIYNVKYIHWNTGTKFITLRHCNSHHGWCIHWNTGIKHTVLYHYNIHDGKYIHWNIGITPTALVINKQFIGLY